MGVKSGAGENYFMNIYTANYKNMLSVIFSERMNASKGNVADSIKILKISDFFF